LATEITAQLRALGSASVLDAVTGARGALPLCRWRRIELARSVAPRSGAQAPGGDTALPASGEPLRAGQGRLGRSIRGSLRLLARDGGRGCGSVSELRDLRERVRAAPSRQMPSRCIGGVFVRGAGDVPGVRREVRCGSGGALAGGRSRSGRVRGSGRGGESVSAPRLVVARM
jgi:hypothetical protein